MFFIGIDPGKSGGISMLNQLGERIFSGAMPQTELDILEALRWCCSEAGGAAGVRAAIEKVHSSPQMGVVSAFTFGVGYGGLKMALAAVGVSFQEVSPQRWQRDMGCLTKGDKNVSKAAAQHLFPSTKVTHANADSLLIAEWLRRHSSASIF